MKSIFLDQQAFEEMLAQALIQLKSYEDLQEAVVYSLFIKLSYIVHRGLR